MNLLPPFLRTTTPASLRSAAGTAWGGRGRAFTLIEMLIAVGAVGLIAVGLAKLFSSTGEVVKLGKRSSAMTEAAATLENQIRRDISAMVTQGEGFIVIRNKLLLSEQLGLASNPLDGIPLSADDRNPSPRPRRIDEFVFFTHGNYTSAREPQAPGRAPFGSAARIYYGHGMQRDSYDVPRIDTDPLWNNTPAWPAGLGRASTSGGSSGPNLYAGNWTLLRQTTVLAPPQQTQWKPPATVPAYLNNNNWPDSNVQIGLQPAAASIFRFDPLHPTKPDIQGYGYLHNTTTPPAIPVVLDLVPAAIVPGDQARMDSNLTPNSWPSFASGIVDVSSIDLSTIRARVIGLGKNSQPGGPPYQGLRDGSFAFAAYPQSVAPHMTLAPGNAIPNPAFLDPDYGKNVVHAQKMMMASALPGNDPWLFAAGGGLATPTMRTGSGTSEQRMIYASTPPDFTGNLTNGGTPWPANEPFRQQDQAMLSASNLAVGCTEFIVEWSFGDVFPGAIGATVAPAGAPVGQIIWHGLHRNVPGSADVNPYRAGTSYNGGAVPDAVGVPAALIHWPVDIPDTGFNVPWAPGGTWDQQQPVYSFFGYQDPSFAGPGTRTWPWPKLLRFTIGLTDPADPSFEQVIQFVVEIPSRQHLQ